jgi:hypothetical protein
MKYEYLFKSFNIFYNYILNNGSIDTNAYLKPCYNLNNFCCDISIKCPYVYILFNSNWRANIFNIIHASILEIIFTGEMYHHDIVYKNTLFHEINNNYYVRILIINSIHGFNANIAKNILNAFPEIIFLLVRSIKGDDFTHIPININSTKKLYCSKNYTNNISDISELSCIFDTYSSVYNVEKLLIKYNFINNKLIKNANKF